MKTTSIMMLLLFTVASSASASTVTKEQWLAAMKTVLPTAFCNSAQYFRQCFNVSVEQCEETTASATRVCLNQHSSDIPDLLEQPKDGTYWGTKVGECAGIAYEASLIEFKISNAKCNDVSNWQ